MAAKNIKFTDANEFLDVLIQGWAIKGASDIHIVPGKTEVTVRFRMFGELENIFVFPKDLFDKFNNTIKIRALMDISEQNHIQDGKIFMTVNIDNNPVGVNLRVSCLPSIYGENIVIRLLMTQSKHSNISSLGFSQKITEKLQKASQINEWLILVCGGTGSGKTTSLYAVLNELDSEKKSIFTLENPVEYVVDGYVQSQIHIVNGDHKSINSYTFAEWLIGILRQDPDVIMIGEMRRKDEVETCLEAANTGHVVMGTIHSNTSIWVIDRMRQFDIPSYLIASSLKYIVCQKMTKLLCEKCKVAVKIWKTDVPEKFREHMQSESIDVFSNNPEWCSKCTNWYSWRAVLAEIIEMDDKLYTLILDNVWDIWIKTYLMEKWWTPIYLDWLTKAREWKMNIFDVIKL